MKKIRFLTVIAFACACVFGMSSCQDDLFPSTDSDNVLGEQNVNRKDSVAVLRFDQFQTPNDVTVSRDTSYICVSDAYLSSRDIKLKEGMYVDVWRAADESAFVVKIDDVEPSNGTSCRYYVEPASFKDVLPEGSYDLNLDPYINTDLDLRLGDGSINSEAYYRDSDATYHPIAYKMIDNGLQGAETETYCELPFAKWNSPMVEDQLKANGTIGGKFIDAKATTSFVIPLGNDWGSIGIDKLSTEVYASMTFTLDIGTHYFVIPYVQKFEASAGGGLNFEVDASFQFGKSFTLWDESVPVFKFGHYVATFSIWGIPISIDCDPQIDLSSKATVSGKFAFKTSYKCGFDLLAGVGYYDGSGWKNLSHATGYSDFSSARPVLYGQASANLGLFLSVPFKVYGCAGPKFSAGPQVKSLFTGSYDLNSNKISSTGNVDLVFGGTVGAEINVLGHEFAKWQTELDLFTKHIWDAKWDINSSDSEEAKQMVEDAKIEYSKYSGGYNVRYYNLYCKESTMDASGSSLSTLTARPEEIAAQIGGHHLAVGDFVDIYYDTMHSYKLYITAIEDYDGPYSCWFGGCKIYHFRTV